MNCLQVVSFQVVFNSFASLPFSPHLVRLPVCAHSTGNFFYFPRPFCFSVVRIFVDVRMPWPDNYFRTFFLQTQKGFSIGRLTHSSGASVLDNWHFTCLHYNSSTEKGFEFLVSIGLQLPSTYVSPLVSRLHCIVTTTATLSN